jgi:hypothetical protein
MDTGEGAKPIITSHWNLKKKRNKTENRYVTDIKAKFEL